MDPLAARSEKLLHGVRRLEIAALIASLPLDFRTAQLMEIAVGHRRSDVSKEIRHFLDCELLDKTKHGHYRRLHEAFWQGCRALHDDWVAELRPPAPTPLRSVRKRPGTR